MPRTRAEETTARLLLALVCAAQLMVVLDVSVVNVALPSIRSSLGFSAAGLPWVAHAYTLAFGGLLLLGGRLADLYGHRRVFAAGLALFCAASLLGGAAPSPGLLVAARALQGVGAAVLAPATLTILTASFPEGRARVRALAAWTAVSVAGGAVGNLLGGALTEALSWRAILLVNVPVGIAALVMAPCLLGRERRDRDSRSTGPPGRDPRGRSPGEGRGGRIDLPGAVTATGGTVALTYGLTRTAEHGWGDPAAAAVLAAGVLSLALFAAAESRAPAPLLPPGLLRRRAVWAGNAMVFLAGACFQVPMWYFLTFYMQDELGFGPLLTGLGFLPHTLVTMAVGWLVTPWLMGFVRARTLIGVGCLTAAAGFAWQAAAVTEQTYAAAVLGPAVLMSVGGGLFTTPLTAVVTSGAAPGDAGAVSGLMNAAKQTGGALGLAWLTTTAASGHAPEGEAYGPVFGLLAAVQLVAAALTPVLPRETRRDPSGGA
ncbi:MFS transporter [Nocardiopsis dassonvillei]|uniref:MFS transporter n=1 Tax=Nocardiopsis dassonvillei TaxID=2014 RepID=UPI0020A2CA42|nr:MFS transporter [Nocardiopsis dassonvillei]MCP3012160.1 MFS transporter [Nocardiopsis dassonvillei]